MGEDVVLAHIPAAEASLMLKDLPSEEQLSMYNLLPLPVFLLSSDSRLGADSPQAIWGNLAALHLSHCDSKEALRAKTDILDHSNLLVPEMMDMVAKWKEAMAAHAPLALPILDRTAFLCGRNLSMKFFCSPCWGLNRWHERELCVLALLLPRECCLSDDVIRSSVVPLYTSSSYSMYSADGRQTLLRNPVSSALQHIGRGDKNHKHNSKKRPGPLRLPPRARISPSPSGRVMSPRALPGMTRLSHCIKGSPEKLNTYLPGEPCKGRGGGDGSHDREGEGDGDGDLLDALSSSHGTDCVACEHDDMQEVRATLDESATTASTATTVAGTSSSADGTTTSSSVLHGQRAAESLTPPVPGGNLGVDVMEVDEAQAGEVGAKPVVRSGFGRGAVASPSILIPIPASDGGTVSRYGPPSPLGGEGGYHGEGVQGPTGHPVDGDGDGDTEARHGDGEGDPPSPSSCSSGLSPGIILPELQHHFSDAHTCDKVLAMVAARLCGTQGMDWNYGMQVHTSEQPLEDGRWLAMEIFLVRDPLSGAAALLVSESDISDLKQTQMDLQAASRAKSTFLANMSHEVRTPMNGILGMLQYLKTTEMNEVQEECVETCLSSGFALMRILNDVMDLSKVEAGKLNIVHERITWDKLFQMLDDIASMFSHQVHNRGVEMLVSYPTPTRNAAGQLEEFRGDVLRIRQILNNFVSNASKFTQKGFIRISLEAGDLVEMANPRKRSRQSDEAVPGSASASNSSGVPTRSSNWAKIGSSSFGSTTSHSSRSSGSEGSSKNMGRSMRISVQDSGMGIEPDRHRAIFEKFTQASDSVMRTFGGSGLGLTIANQLATMMQGRIELQSKLGEGTTMTCVLPLELSETIISPFSSMASVLTPPLVGQAGWATPLSGKFPPSSERGALSTRSQDTQLGVSSRSLSVTEHQLAAGMSGHTFLSDYLFNSVSTRSMGNPMSGSGSGSNSARIDHVGAPSCLGPNASASLGHGAPAGPRRVYTHTKVLLVGMVDAVVENHFRGMVNMTAREGGVWGGVYAGGGVGGGSAGPAPQAPTHANLGMARGGLSRGLSGSSAQHEMRQVSGLSSLSRLDSSVSEVHTVASTSQLFATRSMDRIIAAATVECMADECMREAGVSEGRASEDISDPGHTRVLGEEGEGTGTDVSTVGREVVEGGRDPVAVGGCSGHDGDPCPWQAGEEDDLFILLGSSHELVTESCTFDRFNEALDRFGYECKQVTEEAGDHEGAGDARRVAQGEGVSGGDGSEPPEPQAAWAGAGHMKLVVVIDWNLKPGSDQLVAGTLRQCVLAVRSGVLPPMRVLVLVPMSRKTELVEMELYLNIPAELELLNITKPVRPSVFRAAILLSDYSSELYRKSSDGHHELHSLGGGGQGGSRTAGMLSYLGRPPLHTRGRTSVSSRRPGIDEEDRGGVAEGWECGYECSEGAAASTSQLNMSLSEWVRMGRSPSTPDVATAPAGDTCAHGPCSPGEGDTLGSMSIQLGMLSPKYGSPGGTPRQRAKSPFSRLPPQVPEPPAIVDAPVLVVEDGEVNRIVAKKLLGRYFGRVDMAENGAAAVALVNTPMCPFCIVFMDINMPVLDGNQACRAMREYEVSLRLLPRLIVAMTGHALDPARKQELRATGFDDCLEKPVSFAQLTRLVQRFFPAESASVTTWPGEGATGASHLQARPLRAGSCPVHVDAEASGPGARDSMSDSGRRKQGRASEDCSGTEALRGLTGSPGPGCGEVPLSPGRIAENRDLVHGPKGHVVEARGELPPVPSIAPLPPSMKRLLSGGSDRSAESVGGDAPSPTSSPRKSRGFSLFRRHKKGSEKQAGASGAGFSANASPVSPRSPLSPSVAPRNQGAEALGAGPVAGRPGAESSFMMWGMNSTPASPSGPRSPDGFGHPGYGLELYEREERAEGCQGRGSSAVVGAGDAEGEGDEGSSHSGGSRGWSVPAPVAAAGGTGGSTRSGKLQIERIQSPRGMRMSRPVLVADDNKVNRMVAAKLLGRFYSNIHFAVNGKEALDMVIRGGPRMYELILMDISMPVKGGLASARLVREHEARYGWAPTFILAVLANPKDEDIVRKEGGAIFDGMLQKPLSLEDVRQVVADFSGIAQQLVAPPQRTSTSAGSRGGREASGALWGGGNGELDLDSSASSMRFLVSTPSGSEVYTPSAALLAAASMDASRLSTVPQEAHAASVTGVVAEGTSSGGLTATMYPMPGRGGGEDEDASSMGAAPGMASASGLSLGMPAAAAGPVTLDDGSGSLDINITVMSEEAAAAAASMAMEGGIPVTFVRSNSDVRGSGYRVGRSSTARSPTDGLMGDRPDGFATGQPPLLNFSPSSSSAGSSSRGAGGSSGKRELLRDRILVVDDNRINRLVASKLLGRFFCNISFAVNGKEALDAFVEASRELKPFKMVFMDIQMPVMDGNEATKCIRQFQKSNGEPPVPIVAVTAHAMREDIQHDPAIAYDSFIPKPVTMREVEDLVEHFFPHTSLLSLGHLWSAHNHFTLHMRASSTPSVLLARGRGGGWRPGGGGPDAFAMRTGVGMAMGAAPSPFGAVSRSTRNSEGDDEPSGDMAAMHLRRWSVSAIGECDGGSRYHHRASHAHMAVQALRHEYGGMWTATEEEATLADARATHGAAPGDPSPASSAGAAVGDPPRAKDAADKPAQGKAGEGSRGPASSPEARSPAAKEIPVLRGRPPSFEKARRERSQPSLSSSPPTHVRSSVAGASNNNNGDNRPPTADPALLVKSVSAHSLRRSADRGPSTPPGKVLGVVLAADGSEIVQVLVRTSSLMDASVSSGGQSSRPSVDGSGRNIALTPVELEAIARQMADKEGGGSPESVPARAPLQTLEEERQGGNEEPVPRPLAAGRRSDETRQAPMQRSVSSSLLAPVPGPVLEARASPSAPTSPIGGTSSPSGPGSPGGDTSDSSPHRLRLRRVRTNSASAELLAEAEVISREADDVAACMDRGRGSGPLGGDREGGGGGGGHHHGARAHAWHRGVGAEDPGGSLRASIRNSIESFDKKALLQAHTFNASSPAMVITPTLFADTPPSVSDRRHSSGSDRGFWRSLSSSSAGNRSGKDRSEASAPPWLAGSSSGSGSGSSSSGKSSRFSFRPSSRKLQLSQPKERLSVSVTRSVVSSPGNSSPLDFDSPSSLARSDGARSETSLIKSFFKRMSSRRSSTSGAEAAKDSPRL
eukprot:jgi/Mesvir1/16742/Mv15124-RA.1